MSNPSETTVSEALAPHTQSPFMSATEVLAYTGYKHRPTLYTLVAHGFPAPVAFGPLRSNGRARKVAWLRSEIYQWAEDQIAASRHLHDKNRVDQPA